MKTKYILYACSCDAISVLLQSEQQMILLSALFRS